VFPITLGGWSVRRALVVAAAPLLAVLPVVALTAGPAQAHDVLVRTEPADGAVLAAPPTQLRLVFEEQALRLGTGLRVTGPDGAVIATGPVQVVGSVVTQPLPSGLPAGRYGVVWRVTSADGHPVSGRFAFTATGASASGRSSPASSPGGSSSGAAGAASSGVPAPSSGVVAAPSTGNAPGTSSSVSVSGLLGIVAAALAVAAVAVLGLMAASRRRPQSATPSSPPSPPSEPPSEPAGSTDADRPSR
jgi:methionine-rich copper-binding protein CopC